MGHTGSPGIRGMARLSGLPLVRGGRPCRLLCCSLWLAALGGCMAASPQVRDGIPSSRVVTVQREHIPPFGGQTIRPPQRMADVATLWKPLTPREQARLAAHDGRASRTASAAPSVAAWLPPSGEEVMRESLYRLTVSQKTVTRRVLDRAADLLPMIASVLEEHALPPELAALPLVESAFEPLAVSHAGAAGLWQLMPVTARRFGLIVDASRDERFDPRKATEAAARYLRWLNGCFKDWPLALAAYNCGEGAMKTFLRRYGATTLEGLYAAGRDGVPRETLRFVPQFVAAATVMTANGQLAPPRETTRATTLPAPAPVRKKRASASGRAPTSPPEGAGTVPAMRRISR